MPGYGMPVSQTEMTIIPIFLIVILPISWPLMIFLTIDSYDDKHFTFRAIMYFILIPLWIVLSPIGIPLMLIIIICFNNKK